MLPRLESDLQASVVEESRFWKDTRVCSLNVCSRTGGSGNGTRVVPRLMGGEGGRGEALEVGEALDVVGGA